MFEGHVRGTENGQAEEPKDNTQSEAHGPKSPAAMDKTWRKVGKEGESGWNNFNDVDDFYKSGGFSDTEYSQLGGRVYAKYVVVNPTSWAVSDADPGVITDYKQITVKVGIESLQCMKRSGANAIITYYAKDVLKWMK